MSVVKIDKKTVATEKSASNDANVALLGRQPILDRFGRTRAYELLFRPTKPIPVGEFDGNRATANVITNALTEFNLDDVIGPHKAFINFTDDLLQNNTARLLPKERVVLEVLEDVQISKKLIRAVAILAEEGYEIALDDFVFEPAWEPLILLASTIKLDVLALSRTAIEAHVKKLQRYDVKLLAEKVEDFEQHEWLMNLGFDLFQGYYYAKPNIVTRASIPQNHMAVVSVLAALNKKSSTIAEIEKLVSEDVSLSYRLLRYINSAFVALPQKVESIQRAVIYFGLDMLRQWASLLVMASVDGKPKVLMENALVRAHMCERLAVVKGLPDPESYFTVGLFSILDTLLDMPMESIVEPLPLAQEIDDALVHGTGRYARALKCVVAYERCEWGAVVFEDLDKAEIGKIYLESIDWAFDASAGL